MFCPKCGNKIQQNQKSCTKCGYKIDDSKNVVTNNITDVSEETSTQVSHTNTFIKKVIGNKKLLIVLGVVVVLIIGIIVTIALVSGEVSDKNSNNDISGQSSSEYVDFDNTEPQKLKDKDVIAFISSVSDISGGVAEATLETEDGKSYNAIIDIDGNVRYICDKSEKIIYAPKSENDIGCAGSENSSTYKLINAKGEVIKTCDGSEFDEFVAFGNGYALVHKYQATIDSEAHLYGVINNKGEWTVKLTDYGQEPFRGYSDQYSNDDDIWADYIGSNIFDIRVGYSNNEHMLLNATNGKAFWVYVGFSGYEDYDGNISFEDGEHYFICNMGGTYYHAFVSDIPLRANGKIDGDFLEDKKDLYRTSHDFVLYPDGTWKSIMEYPENGYEGITSDYPAMNGYEKAGDKWTKVEGDYITIYDYDTKTSAQFTDYKSSVVSGMEFEGDYSMVRIGGVDQKSYFTIIDSKGTMQFDPIMYGESSPKYSSGKVVYQNTSGQYIIADTSGKIISENLNFDYINGFNGDIAEASKDGKICFINSKGEVLLYEIKLPSNIS